jgi:hypothetical protein
VPSSRAWDIGGPDVLEYGAMMRVYAEVAGLRKRRLIVLPFLTPTIASLWVGAVTPIPSGLARPLIESLECDAVMRNFKIDTIIEPPPGGLTGYRRAVELALNRAAHGLPDATWAPLRTEPAESLPSDPEWAGEVVYTDVRTTATVAKPDDVWRAAENAANGNRRPRVLRRWSIEEREPGSRLRLRAQMRSPGRAWLEITVTPRGGGSTYMQRAIFVPRGIVGQLYWLVVWPLRTAALSALARDIVASAR